MNHIVASNQHSSDHFVAIDLGSNSFHMVIAHVQQGELKILGRLSEKVQLAAGLDLKREISEGAQQRGLDCLAKFAQRMHGISASNIRVVGTNALRKAKNARFFIARAEELLGIPIEVIAGREEARLIYLGASHFLDFSEQNRLIIDIGGGSTEFMLGKGFEPKILESLHMGCISYRDQFFPDGKITKAAFNNAVTKARTEMLSIDTNFKKVGWHKVAGTSGSIRVIEEIITAEKKGDGNITFRTLKWLKNKLIDFGHVSKISFPNLKQDRLNIFPSGVAILYAAFEHFELNELVYSDGALREGLLYDQLGRLKNEDVRDRTTDALMERYHIDQEQAERVKLVAIQLWEGLKANWKIDSSKCRELLERSAKLHEIGLTISHTQFHKHGAYLVRHSDLAGFSRQEQVALSLIIRAHRRKFPADIFEELPPSRANSIRFIAIIFRLAVLLCHTRTEQLIPLVSATGTHHKIELVFEKNWLEGKPLTQAELAHEANYLQKVGFTLDFC